jgi:DNA polymerase I-like protein with 3'-5' exonuclease and polymerase domains
MKITIDVENTVTKRDGKMHLDPYEPTNKLVMVGMIDDNANTYIYDMENGTSNIQEMLDTATVLIGHNITYDLMWLWECGFKYDGVIFDTMLAEYILQKGIKEPLSLEACANRHNLVTKKQDTLKEYFAKGMGVDEIPKNELKEYLIADLKATQELSKNQYIRLTNTSLMDTVILTNKVAMTLARTHRNGFKVDKDVLESVRKEFEKEKQEIETRLSKQVRLLMGDTPINLNSPEQMSWVIYSRKIKDKLMWGNNFTPYMSVEEYKENVKEHSQIIYKTKAKKCIKCNGNGHIRKIKKDGSPYSKPSKCVNCDALGYLFEPTNVIAGLKFNAPNSKWVSANGFSVNKNNLFMLQNVAKKNNMTDASNFLNDLQRLSALDTYLSSFVHGINTYIKPDGMLHVRLLQHRTSTGRFSGADPNMQNMPRGGTFPVKKVFVSRWKGGKILEADFAQLEFRTAAYLSQDEVAINEIKTGFDVHSYTANVITKSGQETSRQDAKAHTFAPLYGATGYGRTEAEARYYKEFTKKYKGIAVWHSRLAKEALEQGSITTPSGRQFSFPDVERRRGGSVSHFTQIKNYPVQSFATADIVPLILIKIEEMLQDYKSCIVNTVHDSIVIDVHPEEENQVIWLMSNMNRKLKDIIDAQFNIDFNVPLLLETKIGINWLDTKDVS